MKKLPKETILAIKAIAKKSYPSDVEANKVREAQQIGILLTKLPNFRPVKELPVVGSLKAINGQHIVRLCSQHYYKVECYG